MSVASVVRRYLLDRITRATERNREWWLPYALVLPTVAYVVLVVWGPFGKLVWDLPLRSIAAGFSPSTKSLLVTVVYALQIPVELVLGTVMALLVHRMNHRRVAAVVSGLFLLPWVIPPVSSGTLFRYLVHPNIGPVWFVLIDDWHLVEQPIYWQMATPGWPALGLVTAVAVWTWSPFVFLLVYYGLSHVPSDHYEAGRVFGAGAWERFRYITYPQIKSTLLLVVIIRIVWNLGKVSQPQVLTGGGPDDWTEPLGLEIYRLSALNIEDSFPTIVTVMVLSLAAVSVFVYKFEQLESRSDE